MVRANKQTTFVVNQMRMSWRTLCQDEQSSAKRFYSFSFFFPVLIDLHPLLFTVVCLCFYVILMYSEYVCVWMCVLEYGTDGNGQDREGSHT